MYRGLYGSHILDFQYCNGVIFLPSGGLLKHIVAWDCLCLEYFKVHYIPCYNPFISKANVW